MKPKKTLTPWFFLVFLIFLSIPNFKPYPCSATLIWSDNFDRGNYDGWIVSNGTFSADDKCLRTIEEKVWHLAYHPSSVIYGTWSIDVYVNTTDRLFGDHLIIFLLADNLEIGESVADCETYGYDIMIYIDPPSYRLWRREGEKMTNVDEWIPPGVSGWQHIDVTRDTNGQFCIFVDGILYSDPIDTTITSSNYFGFVAQGGHALDNITVNDEIIVFPKPCNLEFKKDSVLVSCEQGSSNLIPFWVYNHGEAAGCATLTIGETPTGITVSLEPENIIDLKGKKRGYSEKVNATIEVSTSVSPGDYNVTLELHNDSSVLDTMELAITVEATEQTSTTTTLATSNTVETTSTMPPQAGTFPSFFPLIIFMGTFVVIFRKRKKT